MSMKLSYRDKVIFIVVIVLVVLLGGFFLIVKPKISESQQAKNDLAAKEQEKAQVDERISTLDTLKERLENDIKEVDEMQEIFLDEQKDFDADQYLHDLIAPSGVQFRELKEARSTEGDLSEYFYTRESLAYDIKMNADLKGDSLPQEVYDKYYGSQTPAGPTIIVAKNTLEYILGIPRTESGAPDFEIVENVWDIIAEHDKTINLYKFESADKIDVDLGNDQKETFEAIKVVVDIYSIHHMDTEQAK